MSSDTDSATKVADYEVEFFVCLSELLCSLAGYRLVIEWVEE